LNKLISKDLVIGLPKIKFEKDKICAACQKGKQVRSSFHSKNILSTSKPLELLHMDLRVMKEIIMLLLLWMTTLGLLGHSFLL